jgi:hypothetical protein
MATGSELLLTDDQHVERRTTSHRSVPLLASGYVRAKLDPAAGRGASFSAIKQRLQTTAPTIIRKRVVFEDHMLTIIRWKQRFLQNGLDGLDTFHPGQTASVLTPALRARILAATRKKPSDGSTHWSCRKLAVALRVSKDAVHRVWKSGKRLAETAPSATLYG